MEKTSCLVLVTVAVAFILISVVQGQSYHFSNGWLPGKRASQTSTCQFRSEVKALILRLIEEEVTRLQTDRSCMGGMTALKNFIEARTIHLVGNMLKIREAQQYLQSVLDVAFGKPYVITIYALGTTELLPAEEGPSLRAFGVP